MQSKKLGKLLVAAVAISIGVFSCKHYLNHSFRRTYEGANQLLNRTLPKSDFYKVHLKNGNVALFEHGVFVRNDSLLGLGTLYDFNRNQIDTGQLVFHVDEVAILETNDYYGIKSLDDRRLKGIAILSIANAAISTLCAINPKACFGSCPTFYLEGHNELHSSSAEGFSASISPSLAVTDIDALNHAASAGPFSLKMKNEALETHVVDEIQILAVPKKENQEVFHGSNEQFFLCTEPTPLTSAWRDDQSLVEILRHKDDQEYFSKTDSFNLFEEEEIILEFENQNAEKLGLVLNFRQTLLTTFLLYNGISYCGDEVGDYFAKIETTPLLQKNFKRPFGKLGGVRVYYQKDNSEKWLFAGEVFETGPIAKNLQMVTLDDFSPKGKKVKLKLVATKGLWRLDYAALTSIIEEVRPIVLLPERAEILSGNSQKVTSVQQQDGDSWITFPGDESQFYFEIPPSQTAEDYELFLSSTGYYLEWMRGEWLEDKDTDKLVKMLMYNREVWRGLAQEYKQVEAQMDEAFWNSKFTDVN